MPFVLLALALLGPLTTPASAEDLILGVEAGVGWDDNVLFTRVRENGSFVSRVTPNVLLNRSLGDLQYSLEYDFTYWDYRNSQVDPSMAHLLVLLGSYRWSEATQLTLSQYLYATNGIAGRLDAADPGDPVEIVGRVPWLKNRLGASLDHWFSRTWLGEVQFYSVLNDFDKKRIADSLTLDAEASLTYSKSLRDRFGFGLAFTNQDVDSTPTWGSGQTDYYQAFGSWTHLFDPTFSLELRAGPVWIDSDPEAPPSVEGLVEATDVVVSANASAESRFTVFGSAIAEKSWHRVTGSLSYRRAASSRSGRSGGSIRDTLTAQLAWRPSSRWEASLTGIWSKEQLAVDRKLTVVTGSGGSTDRRVFETSRDDEKVDVIHSVLRVERHFANHFSLFATANWRNQKPRIGSSIQRFEAIMGLRWSFEPFQL